ncbi:hypothetical protein TELCIR_16390, partial [Teladorsagia circumcincta]
HRINGLENELYTKTSPESTETTSQLFPLQSSPTSSESPSTTTTPSTTFTSTTYASTTTFATSTTTPPESTPTPPTTTTARPTTTTLTSSSTTSSTTTSTLTPAPTIPSVATTAFSTPSRTLRSLTTTAGKTSTTTVESLMATKKVQKKKRKLAKSMKKMKDKQRIGVKKALEDYLASQYTTSTMDEGVVEMPSLSEPQVTGSQASDTLQKSSSSGAATPTGPPVPALGDPGQMPMENLQEGAEK